MCRVNDFKTCFAICICTCSCHRALQARLHACEWAWGTAMPAEILSAAGAGVHVLLLADVVYDPDGYEPLLHTLHDVLCPQKESLATLHGIAETAPVAIMAHRSRHPDQHVSTSAAADCCILHKATDIACSFFSTASMQNSSAMLQHLNHSHHATSHPTHSLSPVIPLSAFDSSKLLR
jgi:hypothetical protein